MTSDELAHLIRDKKWDCLNSRCKTDGGSIQYGQAGALDGQPVINIDYHFTSRRMPKDVVKDAEDAYGTASREPSGALVWTLADGSKLTMSGMGGDYFMSLNAPTELMQKALNAGLAAESAGEARQKF